MVLTALVSLFVDVQALPKQCFCTTLQKTNTEITHTLNFYQVCHGVGRSVENGLFSLKLG